uniref:Uncharacterized protein n=1 Tax=Chlorobium chlorochromatii (strain CaD3) TaxID=340177 RepID=Q3ASU3_CHLCH
MEQSATKSFDGERRIMYAEKLIVETDLSGMLKKVPKLPPNKQLEAIFLVLSESSAKVAVVRTPHPDIAGKVIIKGDIINCATSSDWDLPQ